MQDQAVILHLMGLVEPLDTVFGFIPSIVSHCVRLP